MYIVCILYILFVYFYKYDMYIYNKIYGYIYIENQINIYIYIQYLKDSLNIYYILYIIYFRNHISKLYIL